MAVNIAELGNRNGYIYECDQSNNIRSTSPNTPKGVRDMIEQSAVNAPLAANRSAFATITVTGVASTGAFTAVNVNGVNQISGNVSVLTSNTTTEAQRLAAAINAFTPASGFDYTAFTEGNIIYLQAPPAAGASVNGVMPVVSANSGTITTTITAFQDGAGTGGTYDPQFGRLYYLNSAVDADPASISGALDITKYITKRGAETGMPTLEVTVASDALTSINRYSLITQLKVDTEGAAATDNLVAINPTGFVEGDLLLIIGESAARVTTVVSQPNASGVSSNPNANIYLSSDTAFATGSLNGNALLLRYIFDNALGGIFVEVLRTNVSGCIMAMTYAQALTAIGAGSLRQGCRYLITDKADLGIVLTASASTSFALEACANYLNADFQGTGNYSGVTGFGTQRGQWRLTMTVPTTNDVAIYNGLHYKNLTGAVGTAPDGDAVNWVLLAKSLTNGYILETDEIHYDVPNDYIGQRQDKRGNIANASSTATNPITNFQWGNNNVRDNKMLGGALLCLNQFGTIANNSVNDGSTLTATTQSGTISSNFVTNQSTLTLTTNTGNVLRNNLSNTSTCSFTSNTGTINNNNISDSAVSSINNSGTISDNNVSGGSIATWTGNTTSITENIITSNSTLTAATNSGTIQGNSLSGNSVMSVSTNSGDVIGNILQGGAFITCAGNTSSIAQNFVLTGAITGANNGAPCTENRVSGTSSSIVITSSAADISNNDLSGGSDITGTSTTGAIRFNVLSSGSSIVATANTGLIESNTISNTSSLVATSNNAAISNCVIDGNSTVDTTGALNSKNVEECSFHDAANVTITIENTDIVSCNFSSGTYTVGDYGFTDLENKTYQQGFSNFPLSKDRAGNAMLDWGAAFNFAAEMHLSDSTTATPSIYMITNAPTNHRYRIYPDPAETLTVTAAAAPSASNSNLINGMLASYVLLGNNRDFIEFENIDGVNMVTNYRKSI